MGIRRFFKNYFYRKKYKNINFQIQNIKNQNVLITGTNSGIGLALVKQLLNLNNKVFATYNKNLNNLKSLKTENLELIKCDNSNFSEIELIKNVIFNKEINIIINNTGIWGQEDQGNIENIDYEDFLKTVITNAISVVKIVNIVLKYSKKNSLKIIMNISSRGGSITENFGGAYVYRASKTMLNSITKTMSIDLFNRFKIISFVVDPGNVQTSMNKNGLLNSEDCAKNLITILEKCTISINGKFIDSLQKEIPW